jgi:hypothetical protein
MHTMCCFFFHSQYISGMQVEFILYWSYILYVIFHIVYICIYIYIYIHTKFTHCLINTWMKVSLSYHHVFSRNFLPSPLAELLQRRIMYTACNEMTALAPGTSWIACFQVFNTRDEGLVESQLVPYRSITRMKTSFYSNAEDIEIRIL